MSTLKVALPNKNNLNSHQALSELKGSQLKGSELKGKAINDFDNHLNSDHTPPDKTNSFVKTVTLGCKVNEYESRMIAEQLASKGYQQDVIIINTCTVTQEADRQSRQAIRKAIRQWHEAQGSDNNNGMSKDMTQPTVVVTGCYAQMNPEEIAEIEGVDLIVGNDKKMTIPQLLIERYQSKNVTSSRPMTNAEIIVGNVDEHVSLPEGILGDFEGQTRAFIQIQQGCNQGCTFCIIHKARGQSQSFQQNDVVAQCKRLLQTGFKEFVICGVDLGAYGEDFTAEDNASPTNLVSLLKALVNIVDDNGVEYDYRLRLSSIDPAHISDELIDLFAHPKICPHIHLSLQSGADLILKRMKRRYGIKVAIDAIDKLRAQRPELILSADVMVGFPTETDAHFAQTMEAIKRLDIAFPHVFIYSNREGTPAAKIPNQVASEIKKLRSEQLRELGQQIKQSTFTSVLGKSMQVLVENNRDKEGRYFARADNYLPVRILCSDKNKAIYPNSYQNVTIIEQNNDFLIAQLVDEQ